MFVHARTFDTRWGVGLAFIDLDDETDAEVMRLQLWAPLAENGGDAKVAMKIGLNAEASDKAQDIMAEANRKALVEMTAERFEAAFEKYGLANALDTSFAEARGESGQ